MPPSKLTWSTRLERGALGGTAAAQSVAGYVRPEFAARMRGLQSSILAAARRHNRQELSGMSDTEFAEVIALILYNEHDGWLEDDIQALRPITPMYQDIQVDINESLLGSNFSVWPANLRPSVGLELLRQQLPVPASTKTISVPVKVYGSKINPLNYNSKRELFAAITSEIRSDDMAVEYLAANIERGLYRAHYEHAAVSWRTLAAWHNQGIVLPLAIQHNATARSYVQRCALYLQAAHQLITYRPSPLEKRPW